MKDEWQFREEICTIGRKMYENRYICATDGNISVRLPGDVLLFTPSGVCKGEMSPEALLKTDLNGQKISGPGQPSSEIQMHLAVYRLRPEVRAVVHAHPPIAIAFTLAGISLAQCILPEVVVTIGNILTAGYATPTTESVADSIRDLVHKTDAIMLERHGSLTLGRSLREAYYHLERMEHVAYITLIARQLGQVRSLTLEQIQDLMQLRVKFGLSHLPAVCNECGICIGGHKPSR
jgi:L-fuculose-phosphate aldolase